MNIKDRADIILYDLGLLNDLKNYGVPHIIGSYTMDIMSHNDLDIDVSKRKYEYRKVIWFSKYVIDKYHPSRYEAKQEKTYEGKTVWFHGFEAAINNELWNFDIWFLDNDAIKNAEDFCKSIKRQLDENPAKKNTIIQIKKALIERNIYSFAQYTSMDVYDAVLKNGILTIDEFLARYPKWALCENDKKYKTIFIGRVIILCR